MPLFAVKAWVVVTSIVIIAHVAGLVALSIFGKKLQNRQEEAQKQLQAAAQNASFLVIDKKKMKLKNERVLSQFIAAPKGLYFFESAKEKLLFRTIGIL